MKRINLIKRLLSNSHEKQSPQRFARYAVMLMMLLTLGVGQMWAKTIYLVPGQWDDGTADFWIHAWGGSGDDSDAKFTQVTGQSGIYQATVADSKTTCQFTRVKKNASGPYDNKWNNSNTDQSISTNNCCEITGWDNSNNMCSINLSATTKVYVTSSTASTMKVNVRLCGTANTVWREITMTKNGLTYDKVPIFEATIPVYFGGLKQLEFKEDNGSYSTKFSTWTTTATFGNKYWDGDSWETYKYDQIGFENNTSTNGITYYDGSSNHKWGITRTGQAANDIGTVSTLYLKEFYTHMYQNTDHINGDMKMYYQIRRQAVSDGSYTLYESKNWENWKVDEGCDANGWKDGWRHPKFGNNSLNINLLEGLYSGKYVLRFYMVDGGMPSYLNNGDGSNYSLQWTIGVPAMATHTCTSDGSGNGSNETPFTKSVGSNLTITVAGTQAARDDNSVLYVSFDGGDTYSTTTTHTINSITSTKQSLSIKAKYRNNTDDIDGTVYDFGTIYYQGTLLPSLAISSFTQDASTVTSANAGETVTINASRENAGTAEITYEYSTDNSNWTTIGTTASTIQSWTLPAVTSTTTYYVKASMTYESTGYSDTENFKVYGKKTIKVKNTNGWYPFYMHRWGGDRADTSFPGDDDQISDYGTGQWKEVVLYSSNDNFIFVDGTNTDNKNSDQTYAGVTDGACYEIASGTGVVALNSILNCPAAPSVSTTDAPTSNTYTAATIKGTISSNGNDNITDYGFYWGTSSTPGTKAQKGTSNYTGDITLDLTSLTPGQTYYYKAYATNGQGTTYGTTYSFKSPYKVTISQSTGCSSISPSGTQYTSGSINLTADAAAGYTFSAWENTNGNLSSAASPSTGRNTVTFTPTSDNATITATYTENTHMVTLAKSGNGHVEIGGATVTSVSGVGIATASGTITAVPDPGYYFTGWTGAIGTGVTLASGTTSSASITINATADSKTITANFAPIWRVAGGDAAYDAGADEMGNWSTTANQITNITTSAGVMTSGYVEVNLPANTEYVFKVFNASTNKYWGKTDAVTKIEYSNRATAVTLTNDDGSDQTFRTAAAGTYRFTWTGSQITIGYPASCKVTFGKGTGGLTITASGSTTGSISSEDYVASGEDVTFTETHTTGYTLTGWYTTKDTGGSTVSGMTTSDFVLDAIAADATVWSRYSENMTTVNLSASPAGKGTFTCGGDAVTSVSAGVTTHPAVTAVPATGYRVNTSATVWSESSDYISLSSTSTNPTTITATGTTGNSATLTATFTPKTYTITLNQNGATTSSSPTSLTATYDGKANGASDVFTLDNPEKTGYTFRGWNTEADTSGTIIVTWAKYYEWTTAYVDNDGRWIHDGDVEVFAMWKSNTYAVTLSTSGETGYGSSAPSDQTATYGTALPTITPPVGAPGYKFQGYFTSAGGAGTKYYNADGTSAKNWDIAGATTLHAYFEKAEITALTHASSVAKGETTYLVVNPTIAPAGASNYMGICWTLHYSENDNEVATSGTNYYEVGTYTEGGSKPNQVRFTLHNLSVGSYYVKAVLKAKESAFSSVCSEGTELNTITGEFSIVGSSTVTIQYKNLSTGDVIASSGSVEIEAGGSAGVKAPNIIGYSFNSWSLGAGVTNTCADGASCGTGKDSINISSPYDGVITAFYTKKDLIYFNNANVKWDQVYVYFYDNGDYWEHESGKGIGAQSNYEISSHAPHYYHFWGAMTQIEGTDVWYFDYQAAAAVINPSNAYKINSYTHVAFTQDAQGWTADTEGNRGYKHFWATKAAYRTDFDHDISMYVPIDANTEIKNESCEYYNTGYWMNYPDNSGYTLVIYDYKDLAAPITKQMAIPFAANKTMPMSITTDLEGSKTYSFEIKRADGNYYGNANTMSNGHSGDGNQGVWEFTHNAGRVGLTTTSAGNYTFTLNYGQDLSGNYNYLVGVRYPESTGDFRVQYKDNVNSTWKTSVVIPAVTEADTVSYFVRQASTPYIRVQKCTATYAGGSTTVTWTDENSGNNILSPLPSAITENGVYNFIFKKVDGALTLDKVEPYTGNFYIRTDGAGSTKWDNYRAADHIMPFSEYSFNQATDPYSHYFAHYYDAPDVSSDPWPNIKFVVANDYSTNISDTIAQDGIADAYVNSDGYLCRDANVRFMYNYKTNEATRRYIDGAQGPGSDNFLLLIPSDDESIYDAETDGNAYSQVKFSDNGNWIYEANVWVKPGTTYKLKCNYGVTASAAFNENGVIASFLKGKESGKGDYETLIGGSGSSRLKIRLLYDFKTNRVVAAYVPSTGEIDGNLAINADIMFERVHQGNVTQITFGETEGSQISAIQNVYSTLKFNKSTITDPGISRYERDLFYVSFPYNVRVSDIIGFGEYGKHWIIEYYDGAGRAEKGFWADSESFWKFVTPAMKNSFTLKAGTGYIVALDLDELWWTSAEDHSSVWDNTSTVELIFPGDISSISNQEVTYTMPSHQCNIGPRFDGGDDRRIKDSHWNVLGVPAYHNTTGTFANHTDVIGGESQVWSTDGKPNYLYTWNMTDNSLSVTPASGYNYKAMHAYVVQYYGDVTFHTSTNAAPASVAARRNENAPRDVEFRLEILQNETTVDQTFVKLSNEEGVSTEFVFGEDLSKEFNKNKANIYTMVTSILDGDASITEAAGNTLPMSNQTTVVPVGVRIATDGDYTFAIPEGTNGIGVTLIDTENNVRTPLGALSYTINLNAGTYDNRFVLEISPVQNTPTSIENSDVSHQDSEIRKVMIDGLLYIVKDGKMFDARGARVK